MIKRSAQEWANILNAYIVMCPTGNWLVCNTKPQIHNNFWEFKSDVMFSIPSKYVNCNMNWRESLHEPKTNRPLNKSGIIYDIFNVTEVQDKLIQGWELYGSPFLDEENSLCQAMIWKDINNLYI